MSAQVYSVPGQTEGRSKTTCGSNISYYKSVHQPILTRENRKHPGNFQSESVSSAFNKFCHFTL